MPHRRHCYNCYDHDNDNADIGFDFVESDSSFPSSSASCASVPSSRRSPTESRFNSETDSESESDSESEMDSSSSSAPPPPRTTTTTSRDVDGISQSTRSGRRRRRGSDESNNGGNDVTQSSFSSYPSSPPLLLSSPAPSSIFGSDGCVATATAAVAAAAVAASASATAAPPPPPTTTTTAPQSVSIDSERQILLLVLLAQVCALHDPTPKTFTVHVLSLFERGLLDRESVKFLFDLGLVPGGYDQMLGGGAQQQQQQQQQHCDGDDAVASPIAASPNDDVDDDWDDNGQRVQEVMDAKGGCTKRQLRECGAIVPYRKCTTLAHFPVSAGNAIACQTEVEQGARKSNKNLAIVGTCRRQRRREGGRSLFRSDDMKAETPNDDDDDDDERENQKQEKKRTIEETKARQMEARRRFREVSAIRKSMEDREVIDENSTRAQVVPGVNEYPAHAVSAPNRSSSSFSSSTSWSVDSHPLSLSRYCREFDEKHILSSGSFGDVFCATNRLDGIDYAVKRVSFAAWGFSDESVRLVVREVECLARIDHAHCVRYYTSWLEPGWMTGGGGGGIGRRSGCGGGANACGAEALALGHRSLLMASGPSFSVDGNVDRIEATFNGICEIDGNEEEKEEEKPIRGRIKKVETSSFLDDGFDWAHSRSVSRRSNIQHYGFNTDRNGRDQDESEYSNWSRDDTASTYSIRAGDGTIECDSDGGSGSSDRLPHCNPLRAQEQQQRKKTGPTTTTTTTSSSSLSYRYQMFLFIQMELCHPSTLADWMQRRNDEELDVAASRRGGGGGFFDDDDDDDYRHYPFIPELEAFRQIASGLAHVHYRGIVHRDLKPANVFVSKSDSVRDGTLVFKVGDFGLSKLLYDRRKSPTPAADRIDPNGTPSREARMKTRQGSYRLLLPASGKGRRDGGALHGKTEHHHQQQQQQESHTAGIGTASYAAPEQIETSTYGPEADVYSLGLILLELLGRFGSAHERASAFRDCRRLGEVGGCGGGEEIKKCMPWLTQHPEEVAATIAACTRLDPRERPTARDVEAEAGRLCRRLEREKGKEKGAADVKKWTALPSAVGPDDTAPSKMPPEDGLAPIPARTGQRDDGEDQDDNDAGCCAEDGTDARNLRAEVNRLQDELRRCRKEIDEQRKAMTEKDETIAILQRRVAKTEMKGKIQ